jgi:protein-disulfide isomerase
MSTVGEKARKSLAELERPTNQLKLTPLAGERVIVSSALRTQRCRSVCPRLRLHLLVRLAIATCSPLLAQPAGPLHTGDSCQVSATPGGSCAWPESYIGPAEAPVTIIVFSDFESFECARSASVLKSLLGEGNDLRVIFKHAPAPSNANSMLAHEASIAAAAQGKFVEMHDLLFGHQTKLRLPDLVGYAKEVGLNLPVFEKALANHEFRSIVEHDLADARGLGVSTTPTFFVNGRRLTGPQGDATFRAVIDSALASKPKRISSHEQIKAAGPAHTIQLEHAPTKGNPGAPVSIVEFSDFECPFCAESVAAIRQLLRAYPTQVRFSFKHYPLPIHRDAPLAHEAAMAAGEQGKFWEMHDLIFATQSKLTREDLVAKAKVLNLDVPRFVADLDKHRFKAVVEADRREGDRLGVDATPFFFINGHAVSETPDLRDFKRMIDAVLKERPPDGK